MVTSSTFILALPLEAQQLLDDNKLDLLALLRTDGLDVRRRSNPTNIPPSDGAKEVLITILAVGITSMMLASSISKILDAVGRNKKFVVKEHVLNPVLDGKGKPVMNSAGKPLTYWADKTRVIESSQTTQDKLTVSVEVPTLLKCSIRGGA